MRTLAILPILLLAVNAHAAEKPNIVVIYADDMGYGDCTVNNPESKIPTPNIDRLAKEGLRFTDAHSPSATCAASRYGLLTGVNPARTGVVNGLTGLGPVIDTDEVTVADFLKDQGYVTRMIGKWHLGFDLHGGRPAEDVRLLEAAYRRTVGLWIRFVLWPVQVDWSALFLHSRTSTGREADGNDSGDEEGPEDKGKGSKRNMTTNGPIAGALLQEI